MCTDQNNWKRYEQRGPEAVPFIFLSDIKKTQMQSPSPPASVSASNHPWILLLLFMILYMMPPVVLNLGVILLLEKHYPHWSQTLEQYLRGIYSRSPMLQQYIAYLLQR